MSVGYLSALLVYKKLTMWAGGRAGGRVGGRQGDGTTGRRGDGAMGRRGDGATERRGDGATGRLRARGDGVVCGVVTDIDECADKRLSSCGDLCENTAGSFLCTCPRGYQLKPDGATCTGPRSDQYCKHQL